MRCREKAGSEFPIRKAAKAGKQQNSQSTNVDWLMIQDSALVALKSPQPGRFFLAGRPPLLKPANRLLGIFAKLFAIARAGIVLGYPLQLRNGACGFERDERFDGSVADIGVGVFEMYY